MFSFQRALLASSLVCSAQFAQANVTVDFREGAPKDRFTITYTGECVLNDVVLNIDLSGTDGKLIFDTTAAGAGVEVFQPFEVTQGAVTLLSSLRVNDGDKALSLGIEKLGSGESISFTIDVDDTLTNSELGNIRVSDAEIKGGTVQILVGDIVSASAVFGSNSKAETLPFACT